MDHRDQNEAEKPAGTTESLTSGAAPCSAAFFPRNPERDEKGNAVVYPGMKRYEGVAGIFGALEGMEYIVLAPTVEALEWLVAKYGFSAELTRERCGIVTMERLPNAQAI